MYYSLDPESMLEVIAVQNNSALAGPGTLDLDDGERIDIGQYEHVLLIASQNSGSGTTVIKPKESSSQSASQQDLLDGSGGRPDFSLSFSGNGQNKTKVIRCAGRKQFLNFDVIISTASVRLVVYLIGIRARSGVGQDLDAGDLAALGVA